MTSTTVIFKHAESLSANFKIAKGYNNTTPLVLKDNKVYKRYAGEIIHLPLNFKIPIILFLNIKNNNVNHLNVLVYFHTKIIRFEPFGYTLKTQEQNNILKSFFGKDVIMNHKQYQKQGEKTCGKWCLSFIERLR